MKGKATFFMAASAVILSACGSKSDANEKNFAAALNQYFDQKGELCLDTATWPADFTKSQLNTFSNDTKKMEALEAIGFATSEFTEAEELGFGGEPTGRKREVKRYSLTDAAMPFTTEREAPGLMIGGPSVVKQTLLCWGKKSVDRIVRWDAPIKLGDYQETTVTYTYKIDNPEDWAVSAQIQEAFPQVKSALDGVGKEDTHGVHLTSEGWKAAGLD